MGGLLGAVPVVALGATDPRVEKARADALDDEYQRDLPGLEEAAGSGGSGDARGFPNGRLGVDPHDRRFSRDGRVRDDGTDARDTRNESGNWDAGPLSSLFQFLLWGVVIVGIALLVFWFGAELMRYGGGDAQLEGADREAHESGVDLAVIQRPLGDAEELAARGEYREAIHTLLLRTLQELVRSAAVRVAPAMTSREILARVPLLADAREALAGLITAVEITHFGGDEATLDDYVRCRTQFQRFATAFRASAARAGDLAVAS